MSIFSTKPFLCITMPTEFTCTFIYSAEAFILSEVGNNQSAQSISEQLLQIKVRVKVKLKFPKATRGRINAGQLQ